jgi:hypothetical protein
MDETQLTLKKAIELNQLDKFAQEQDEWLAENGYELSPEVDIERALETAIKSSKSEDQT